MNINQCATCPWVYRTNSIELLLVMLTFVKGSVIVLAQAHVNTHIHATTTEPPWGSPHLVSPWPLPPLLGDHTDLWQT